MSVGMFRASRRVRWVSAAVTVILLVTSMFWGVSCTSKPAANVEVTHSDPDGIPDHVEEGLGLDPDHFDTDRDGIPDDVELRDQLEERETRTAARARIPTMRIASHVIARRQSVSVRPKTPRSRLLVLRLGTAFDQLNGGEGGIRTLVTGDTR